MLKSLLIAGIGSFMGGALRYLISAFMKNISACGFPWGTLAVNLLGCLVIGIVLSAFSRHNAADNAFCLLLTTGFCGGFTTFSTFANESVQMLQNGDITGFAGYVAASVILGMALVAFGYWIVKLI